MATTTKKGSKNKKAKLRRPVVKTSVAEQAQTIAELRRQLAESLQRETTAERERAVTRSTADPSARRGVEALTTCDRGKELQESKRRIARGRWSTRRRRPRCSALSAARRRTYSRCSTPSSKARNRFVGSDDVVLQAFAEGDAIGLAGAFWHPITEGRVDGSAYRRADIFAGLRETRAHFHVPDAKAPNDFPVGTIRPLGVRYWLYHFASRENSLDTLNARRIGDAPLHSGADQAARNFR